MNDRLTWGHFADKSDAFHVVRLHLPAKLNVAAHGHEQFAECFLVESGQLKHTVNRRTRLLDRGDLVMMRPNDIHRIKYTGRPAVFSNVALPINALAAMQQNYPDISECWDMTASYPATRHLSGAACARVSSLIDQLAHAPRNRFEIDRFLMNLFHEMGSDRAQPAVDSTPAWLQKAVRDIRQPECLREGLPAFMRLAGRTPEHVSRVLRQHTGYTPTRLVNEVRLNEAARQLCMTNREIIEIAADCGFENLSYFYRLFLKQFGQTPRKYRDMERAII